MTNHEKDRHVLAVAVHGQVPIIATFNRCHFRREHLEPWGVRALHPQSFLSEIFRQEQPLVMTKRSNRPPIAGAPCSNCSIF